MKGIRFTSRVSLGIPHFLQSDQEYLTVKFETYTHHVCYAKTQEAFNRAYKKLLQLSYTIEIDETESPLGTIFNCNQRLHDGSKYSFNLLNMGSERAISNRLDVSVDDTITSICEFLGINYESIPRRVLSAYEIRMLEDFCNFFLDIDMSLIHDILALHWLLPNTIFLLEDVLRDTDRPRYIVYAPLKSAIA